MLTRGNVVMIRLSLVSVVSVVVMLGPPWASPSPGLGRDDCFGSTSLI